MAVRSEHIDAVGLDVDAQLVGQAADVAQFFVPFEHLTQPGDLFFVMVRTGIDVGALVAPVGADPQFGLLVHGVGADLHLQHLALGADHRGMQRAIAILLGVGDVIVEFLGNVPPQGVHDTQRGVAVTHFRNQHTNGANVVDLAELQALLLHFSPDGIDVLGASVDFRLDAGRGQFVLELLDDIGDVLLAIEPTLVQQLGDLLVLLGLEVAEGQILQLPLDVADAQAVGQRCVDVEDLAGDTLALLVVGQLHRADGAGALGQLDQRDADVVDHGHQHLAQVFHLRLGPEHQRFARVEAGADRRHAQHTFDELGHHRPEALVHIGQLNLALTHAAVDDRSDQAVLIQFEVSEDLGDLQADLIAGGAFAPEVLRGIGLLFRFAGELAGLLQRRTVKCRVHPQHMIEPAIQVDAAVRIDRLNRSDLYHLPSLLRSICAMNAGILRAGRLNHRPVACQKILRRASIPLEQRHGLGVGRLREHVQQPGTLEAEALAGQLARIARQGGRIA